jgi:hypothetical protein
MFKSLKSQFSPSYNISASADLYLFAGKLGNQKIKRDLPSGKASLFFRCFRLGEEDVNA